MVPNHQPDNAVVYFDIRPFKPQDGGRQLKGIRANSLSDLSTGQVRCCSVGHHCRQSARTIPMALPKTKDSNSCEPPQALHWVHVLYPLTIYAYGMIPIPFFDAATANPNPSWLIDPSGFTFLAGMEAAPVTTGGCKKPSPHLELFTHHLEIVTPPAVSHSMSINEPAISPEVFIVSPLLLVGLHFLTSETTDQLVHYILTDTQSLSVLIIPS